MPIEAGKVWYNAKIVDWEKATVHVMAHVVHYGSSVFEGLRFYETPKGSAIFRLTDHIRRLFDSAKIYRMPIPYSADELSQACIDIVKANGYKSGYIRPLVFRGLYELGVNPLNCPVECVVAAWPWGSYFKGKEGISVRISSWNRPAPNTIPNLSKAGGNYLNSQLIKMEAIQDKFDEGIALDTNGYVSEGSGENVFIVKNKVIYTPPTGASILAGITRHTLFILAKELGYRIEKHILPRESLYIADEVFFTGTAAEITPILSIDNIPVSNGEIGPVTKSLKNRFTEIIGGKASNDYGWMTYIS